ncbi:MAG TPA: histidine kinase [Solirubrobacteraceae bacterium]|nr:histidine kinase [Solirubrobacteraceae bacterium]
MSSLPSFTSRPSGAELLRTIAAGTAASVGTAFLRSLVRHVAEALDAEIAFAAEVEEGAWARARVLASHGRGGVELPEGFGFSIAGTPCELCGGQDVVTIPTGTTAAFPQDAFAARHGLDGYLAIVVRGSAGQRLGYLGVMSSHELDAGEEAVAVLRIFAARAGAEIERRRHEAALRAREGEIAASRARLVSIADEERRKIGRNLHDGAQQRMIVLGHRIELARRKLEQDPEQAAEHLRHAGEEARAAGAELRELARGLHPAGLAEYGLEPTLAALAGRSPIALEVAALPDRRLPEAIETTIYYLVSGALSNAVKYAGASRVLVEVTQGPDRVVAEVADDGCGGADPAAGSGLAGLASRIDALGGTLDIVSPAGAGTRLRARIPLGPWRTAREPFLEFGHEADGGAGAEMIAKVLSGEKTASISLAREWELEGGTPKIGQRLPVTDHHGRRHGTVEVVRIAVMPFGEVDAGSVEEHEAGIGADQWRAAQRDYYDRCREQVAALLDEPGWRLTDDEPLVVLRVKLTS